MVKQEGCSFLPDYFLKFNFNWFISHGIVITTMKYLQGILIVYNASDREE